MTLTIDGRAANAGGTLLDAVLALGIDLPHLCKDDNLPAIGACRTCLVEADGRVVAACAQPAAAVNEVSSTSERVRRLRRGVLELTLAMTVPGPNGQRGPHSREFEAAISREAASPGKCPVSAGSVFDSSNPFFEFDETACILCSRCTTACQSLQHIGAIGMAGRGLHTRVTPGAGVTFLESICTSCGSCVAACPTTALRPKGKS